MDEPKRYLVMYANYNKVPTLEGECITQNIKVALWCEKICDVILICNDTVKRYITNRISSPYMTHCDRSGLHFIDADSYIAFVKDSLSEHLEEEYLNKMKHNHYADFLAYYSLETLNKFDFKGEKKVLKVDTDVFMTSRFILRSIFNTDRAKFFGVDEGFELKHASPIGDPYSLPNTFMNAHLVYRKSHAEKFFDFKLFSEYVRISIRDNHYTATGPHMINYHYKINDAPRMYLQGLRPWTLDPSTIGLGSLLTLKTYPLVSCALGMHMQSSVISSLGFEVSQIIEGPEAIKVQFRRKK